MIQKSWESYICSSSPLPKEKTLTTTEGEHLQLCLCISSTLLKLLTDSACSQSDDLPCCACITRTSATFSNDDKSLFDQWRQSERPDTLERYNIDPLVPASVLSEMHSISNRINNPTCPNRATTCCIHHQDASAQNNTILQNVWSQSLLRDWFVMLARKA